MLAYLSIILNELECIETSFREERDTAKFYHLLAGKLKLTAWVATLLIDASYYCAVDEFCRRMSLYEE